MAAMRMRQSRERAMVEAARIEIARMMAAIDKHQALYSTLPERLSDLNRVGYREGGGVIICKFEPHSDAGRTAFIELEAKHRSARTSVGARHPDRGTASETANVNCKSVRNAS
ncbi:MAG: hypothetical protein ACT4O1_14805 [Gemmatimonadota bacterium]